MEEIIQKYRPVIGEFVWHSLTTDPDIIRDSNIHYDRVIECINKWAKTPVKKILEVASYAHITGYKMQHELKAKVTLFDISYSTLKLGQKTAEKCGYSQAPKLVAGDFHSMPFDDCSFDLVYISSAIHHTEQYGKVLREMQRVLAPEGLLVILNEPYEREACFYKFRCNRSNAYTLFEKKLAELDLLYTVAEPHPGSRDETLFGMIENQQIPLESFLSILTDKCEIDEITTTYETRLGSLEKQWLKWADDAELIAASLQEQIKESLAGKITIAREVLDQDIVAQGLGFSVPDQEEIEKMSRRIAQKLHSRPSDKSSLGYQRYLSELFGGSFFAVCHKKASLNFCHGEKRRRLEEYPVKEGVRMCFTPDIAKFLNNEYSLVPPIHIKESDRINRFFPVDDWKVQKEDNGFYTLTPTTTKSKIILPPLERKKYLILLRINFSLPEEDEFYRFEIFNESKLIYDYAVFREDAILYRTIVSSLGESDCALSCMAVPVDQHSGKEISLPQAIKIYYAGIFALPIQLTR